MPDATRIPDISEVRAGTLSRFGARVDHLYHALVRRRFARIARVLGAYTTPGAVIMDIGANHGRFAKHLAALHGGDCTLYAFEPLEYNRTVLRLAVGRARNVRIVPLALSTEAGQTELFIPYKMASKRFNHGSAHLGDRDSGVAFGTRTAPDVCRAVIDTVRLDDWASEQKLERLDLMKIAVEGAEPLVIEGGLETIARFRPAIYAELIRGLPERVGRSIEDVTGPLLAQGYRMHGASESGRITPPLEAWSPDVRDYLFLHPDPA
ncbi:MAG: FkbM family methyltransferase [Phycisphaerales bacterium JB059]